MTLKICARGRSTKIIHSRGHEVEVEITRARSVSCVIESLPSGKPLVETVRDAIRAAHQDCGETFVNIPTECRIFYVFSTSVGWFYPNPRNSRRCYVPVGKKVKKDQVLYRIEALKHDTEFVSPVTGIVRKRYEKYHASVDYGDDPENYIRPLFVIELVDD